MSLFLRGLTEFNFSIDHQMPVSRSGAHALRNLVVVCQTCNCTKGALSGAEWAELLKVIRGWAPQGGNDLLRRLRAGGRQMGARRV